MLRINGDRGHVPRHSPAQSPQPGSSGKTEFPRNSFSTSQVGSEDRREPRGRSAERGPSLAHHLLL